MTADEIEHLDLPGAQETLQERRDSVRTAHDFLVRVGSATPADIKREVHGEYASSNYVADDADEWWAETGEPGLRQLSDVDPPDGSHGEWRHAPAAD